MIDTDAFAKLAPAVDFLQGLMQSAGQAGPAMGEWIVPTLDPDVLEKRIAELKSLQFWLEQNRRMISATIQAMEVQRMTLSTLRSMNLPMTGLREALTPAAPAAAHAVESRAVDNDDAPSSAKAGVVDPMQWWSALTQQFTELATKAMHDTGELAARNLAAADSAKTNEAATPAAKKSAVRRTI